MTVQWSEPNSEYLNHDVPSTRGQALTGFKLYMYPGVALNLQTDMFPVKAEIQSIITANLPPAGEQQVLSFHNVNPNSYFTLSFLSADGKLASTNSTTFQFPSSNTASAIQTQLQSLCLSMPQLCNVVVALNLSAPSFNSSYEDFVVTFPPQFGDVNNLIIDGSLMGTANPGFAVYTTELLKGGAALSGDFTVSFRGAVTPHIPTSASGPDMARALMNLDTIGVVSVTAFPNATTGASEWRVTFLTEAGDLPPMVVTNGRLLGRAASIVVVTQQQGSPAVLVYDGTDLPNVMSATVTGLTTGTAIAYCCKFGRG